MGSRSPRYLIDPWARRARWAVLALVSTACGSVLAQPGDDGFDGLELEWDAPDDCPPNDTVLAEARRLLGPDFRHRGELEVAVELDPLAGGYLLMLEADGDHAQGERELQVPTCAEARATAGLLLAMLLDPDLNPTEPTDDQYATQDAGAELRLSFAVPVLGLDTALLPGPAFGTGADLGLELFRVQVALGLRYWFARDASGARDDMRYDAPIGLLAGHARTCILLLRDSWWAVGPCVGFWLGTVSAAPNVPGVASRSQLLLAPALGAVVDAGISSLLSLKFLVSGGFPLRPASFLVRSDAGTMHLHSVPAASAQVELALVFHL